MASIGVVYLNVKRLKRSVEFYQDVIGLRVLSQTDAAAALGVDETELLHLTATPDYKRYPRTTGLYHFALRVPTRADLGRTLHHLMKYNVLQGASDHFVSEALYLSDPEGNGIEIYWDRPRSAWYSDGHFNLGTVVLEAQSVLAAAGPKPDWNGLPAGTDIGHIHLHVNDIRDAEAFYTGLLGMDVMVNIGSATFLSYDGYHHHVGANVWSGRTPPPSDALGLDHWELHMESAAKVKNSVSRLKGAGVVVTETESGYQVQDTARNKITLMPA